MDIKTLYTLNDDFGGWPEADPKYFGEDTGLISKIIAGLNIGG